MRRSEAQTRLSSFERHSISGHLLLLIRKTFRRCIVVVVVKGNARNKRRLLDLSSPSGDSTRPSDDPVPTSDLPVLTTPSPIYPKTPPLFASSVASLHATTKLLVDSTLRASSIVETSASSLPRLYPRPHLYLTGRDRKNDAITVIFSSAQPTLRAR
jgi:hypothetical protein